jgi:hypothetical protein
MEANLPLSIRRCGQHQSVRSLTLHILCFPCKPSVASVIPVLINAPCDNPGRAR